MKLFTALLLAFLGMYVAPAQPIYESENLIIIQLSDHTYQHITYLQTNDYGKVGCNGMLVIDQGEAIVFDTPSDDETSIELIDWIEKEQKAKIVAVVPTHFHSDCLGGLGAFHERKIPSIANNKTIELLDTAAVKPLKGFDGQKVLKAGKEKVIVDFVGEGHTADNVIAYVPSEQVMFGGCLIKKLKASKGYLGDANLNEWSKTVEKVKTKYAGAQQVIPGHGPSGGTDLLDYTIEMFLEK